MPIEVDLTELPMSVRAEMKRVLTDECAMQIMQARIRQQKIAKFYHDNRPRAIDGMGPQTMAVDPFWIGYFNMQHGRQVFQDPDFTKWLCKEEEAFRVRSGGTKVQVGFAGHSRFSKRYEWGGREGGKLNE